MRHRSTGRVPRRSTPHWSARLRSSWANALGAGARGHMGRSRKRQILAITVAQPAYGRGSRYEMGSESKCSIEPPGNGAAWPQHHCGVSDARRCDASTALGYAAVVLGPHHPFYRGFKPAPVQYGASPQAPPGTLGPWTLWPFASLRPKAAEENDSALCDLHPTPLLRIFEI